MTITLDTKVDATLPKLAWIARFDLTSETVRCLVGSWVETAGDRIVEGAWAGDFADMNFRRSCSFSGTGMIVDDEEVVLVPPANTMECGFSRAVGTTWWFSNSTPLLLRASGGTLDLEYLDYEADAHSITLGLDAYTSKIPVVNGQPVERHYYQNLVVASDGTVRKEDKDTPPVPRSYSEYADLLAESTKQIANNTRASTRLHRYEPISFCSTGYDSAVCSLLAYDAGAREGISFETSRSDRRDSGHEILRCLGYDSVTTMDDTEYLQRRGSELFLAAGEAGTTIFLNGAADHLSGKVVVAGNHGDNMWERSAPSNRVVLREPFSPRHPREFRIQEGALFFCPAYLTAMIQPEIVKLSSSAEMQPWSLGGDYDRPIPRRMLEERGIPRTTFGMSKTGGVGTSLRFGALRHLRKVMNPEDHAAFRDFVKRLPRRRPTAYHLARSAMYLLYVGCVLLRKRGLGAPQRLFERHLGPKWSCSPFAPRLLFPWAVERLQQTSYRDIDIEHLEPSGAP